MNSSKNSDSVSKSEEKKIYSKIKNRDHEAFMKAYDLYIDDIYRFVYFKVGDSEEAKDLTSSVFLKTWNYIQNESVKDCKTLRALIYKVARNTIIDHYRKNSQATKVPLEYEDGTAIDIEDEGQTVLEKLEILSEYKIVEEKIKELKDEYREVIILRYVNDLSVAEISQIIGKSKGNVRVIISRSLKALKNLIEEDEK